jgi:hypothetical protein
LKNPFALLPSFPPIPVPVVCCCIGGIANNGIVLWVNNGCPFSLATIFAIVKEAAAAAALRDVGALTAAAAASVAGSNSGNPIAGVR